jgi:hypothetical protein
VYLTAEGKAWKALVGWAVNLQRVQPPQDWRKVYCKVTVRQEMVRPLSQDASNGLKISEDAVMEALTGLGPKQNPDRYVDDARGYRVKAAADRTIITVEEYEPCP